MDNIGHRAVGTGLLLQSGKPPAAKAWPAVQVLRQTQFHSLLLSGRQAEDDIYILNGFLKLK